MKTYGCLWRPPQRRTKQYRLLRPQPKARASKMAQAASTKVFPPKATQAFTTDHCKHDMRYMWLYVAPGALELFPGILVPLGVCWGLRLIDVGHHGTSKIELSLERRANFACSILSCLCMPQGPQDGPRGSQDDPQDPEPPKTTSPTIAPKTAQDDTTCC